MAESSVNNPQLIPPNPTTKFYTNFLYKAILVSIFLLLLPLFPSQAPDFINHTINTTSWELLQLVLVGIAVSYGLFSKRNDDDDDDTHNNTHSYVYGLLQVSSVFDDDSENPSASASHHNNNINVHTWNSQYYRGEPIVVVAKESDDATTIEKPLLLPVRSLKKESNSSFSRSNSRRVLTSRNYSKLTTPGESEEENIVLRSPIPWRSRSGRMEVKEDFSQTPSVHEIYPIESSSPSFKRAYQPSKGVSSEEINPSSSSSSSEVESKSLEDVGRRNKSPNPPPPPPPPPPPVSYGQVKVNYNNNNSGKELRRSMRSIPEKLENRRRSQRGEELMTIRSRSDMSRREKERERELLEEYLSHDKEIERFIERRGSQMTEETGKDSEEEEEELACRKNKNCSNGEELTENGVGGPDVDKKADEFIAKFREQIRLQRIASIRRSTAPQTQTQTQTQTGSGR